MKSERTRISMKYRSEGEEEGLKIRAIADQEATRILSEAYKIAQRHKGQGEAEAAHIFADALSAAPDFYQFIRTMEASSKIVQDDTTLLLPANSDLFGLLNDSEYYNKRSPGVEGEQSTEGKGMVGLTE